MSIANSRAQRVLKDRKKSLEAEQTRLMRQLERRWAEKFDPAQQNGLRNELEALISQQQAMEDHLSLMHEETEILAHSFDAHASQSERHKTRERLVIRKGEITEMEKHLSTLGRRRTEIELELRRREQSQHSLDGAWKRRMGHIENELHDVNLALKELTE